MEIFQQGWTEGGGEGDIDGIAAARHHDSSNARVVVAGIKGVPVAVEEDLGPGAEIHGSGIDRYADVAEITRGISGGDVEASQKGDQQMRKITADAPPLLINVKCGFIRTSKWVAKLDVGVNPIANGLNAAPSERGIAEEVPRDIAELVGFAIPAGEQKLHDIRGKSVNIPLNGIG